MGGETTQTKYADAEELSWKVHTVETVAGAKEHFNALYQVDNKAKCLW